MDNPQKGIRIEGYVFSNVGDLDELEFADAFVEFLEANNWQFGGGMKVIEDKQNF